MNEEIVKHDISMIKEYIKTNDETTIIKTLLMIDYLEKYMEENTQLKEQLDVANGKLENMSFSYSGEKLANELIMKKLKDKDDKISKIREYATHTEFEDRTGYDTSFCEGVYKVKENILEILESNKED